MVPSPAGDTRVVSRYCVSKLAVMVVAVDGAVTLCERRPPSLQFSQTYCLPPKGCGEVVASVWLVPTIHSSVIEPVKGGPSSTLINGPSMLVPTVTATSGAMLFSRKFLLTEPALATTA